MISLAVSWPERGLDAPIDSQVTGNGGGGGAGRNSDTDYSLQPCDNSRIILTFYLSSARLADSPCSQSHLADNSATNWLVAPGSKILHIRFFVHIGHLGNIIIAGWLENVGGVLYLQYIVQRKLNSEIHYSLFFSRFYERVS